MDLEVLFRHLDKFSQDSSPSRGSGDGRTNETRSLRQHASRTHASHRAGSRASRGHMYAYTCAFWGCSGLRRFRGDFGPGAHSVENLIVEYVKRKGVGRIGRGGDESKRRRAESQRIVAARPLCPLQYPVAYLSRLQRILPAARLELYFKAADAARPPRGLGQRHVPLGAGGPYCGSASGRRAHASLLAGILT